LIHEPSVNAMISPQVKIPDNDRKQMPVKV